MESKFTQKTQQELIGSVGKGHSLDVICGLANISRQTLNRWLLLGKDPDSKYSSFYIKFQKAKARFKGNLIEDITEEADAKLKLEMLSRIDPQNWGKVIRVQQIRSDVAKEILDFLETELEGDIYLLVVNALLKYEGEHND